MNGSTYEDFNPVVAKDPELNGSVAEDFIDDDQEPGVYDKDEMADRQNDREVCDDCATPLKISKKGNKYCPMICWEKSSSENDAQEKSYQEEAAAQGYEESLYPID